MKSHTPTPTDRRPPLLKPKQTLLMTQAVERAAREGFDEPIPDLRDRAANIYHSCGGAWVDNDSGWTWGFDKNLNPVK